MRSLLNFCALGLAAASSIPRSESEDWTIGQVVSTTSGKVTGHAAVGADGVSEYLGIPYAKAPTDELRWMPPVKFQSDALVLGATFGNACISSTSTRGVGNGNYSYLDHMTPVGKAFVASSAAGPPQSEDCLNLNIWTKPQTGEKQKAVLVWIHGGSFISGSGANSLYHGMHLADSQDLVVVTLNYRLSALASPGSPALDDQNLGLLDQRAAIEWVRDNIANFGGDPDRIVLMGQSAGSIYVDFHSYAFADDPIVSGYIAMSAVATSFEFATLETAANRWDDLAAKMGCSSPSNSTTSPTPRRSQQEEEEEVLACMRNLDAKDLLSNVDSDAIPGSSPEGLWWGPTVDERLVFSDYDEGRVPADRPMLLGNTDDEASLFRAAVTYELTDEFLEETTRKLFTCPTARRAAAAAAASQPTWRYRYMGVFPNLILSYDPPSGSWHSCDIPGLFGTTPETLVANTPEQDSINSFIAGLWASFAKEGKLDEEVWPVYDPSTDSLPQLGLKNMTGSNLVLGSEYDALC